MQDRIKTQASKLLIDSGVAGIYPVPVEKVAEYLDYTCHYFSPNEKTKNISGAVNREKKKIYINPQNSAARQQFTVGHEIGHIILHTNEPDHIDYRLDFATTDSKEAESNLFAANLLMPEDIFIYHWKKFNKDIYALSNFFGVSTSAIAVRANSLNLD